MLVFAAVLALAAYFEHRRKYAFLSTLSFAALACILSAGIGWSLRINYDNGQGLETEAKYGTDTIETIMLLLAGLLLSAEATFVWHTIHKADFAVATTKQDWLSWGKSRQESRDSRRENWRPLGTWLAVRRLRRQFSRIASSWAPLSKRPAKEFPRVELAAILESIKACPSQTVCLIGEKGSGKTTLLLSLVETCIANKTCVLPIKADLLPHDTSIDEWLRNELQIEEEPLHAIERVASKNDVVVVIDQLDALASLVDLTSSRLNQIMAFIVELSKLGNVAVICSSRSVDFRTDTRFQQLDCITIPLTLPSWESIVPVLKEAGVGDPQQLPQPMREMLRNPQHLHVYLRQYKNGAGRGVYLSYYDLLEELWNGNVQSAAEMEVAYKLTSLCMDRESITVPRVLLESDNKLLRQLEVAKIVACDAKTVGFRHQTLLEYAKARLFIKNDESLCRHVLARQNAVRVRPTLWSVLTYLREADPVKYVHELNELFRSELRLHVRYLLIDFLGQVLNPSDQEVMHMTSRLDVDDDRKRVLISIQGNPAWFEKLSVTHFAPQMALPSEEAWPMIGVISQMWGGNRDACLRLVKRNWLPYPEKDELTRRTMTQLVTWDEEAVGVVCTLIRRANAADERMWWAEQLVSTISQDQPHLASDVFVEAMRRRWSGREPSGYRDGPLTDRNGWYDLPEVAKAAPMAFVKCVWPWFVEQANEYHSEQFSTVLNYYGGGRNDFEIDDVHGNDHIVQAMCVALKLAATENPTEFVEITGPTWSSESLPAHRMLAQSLEASIEVNAQVALDYLRQDQRRFFLGSFDKGDQYDSCMLVAALGRSLNQADIDELVQLIIAATPYRADHVIIEAQRQSEYEARQVLLASLPIDRINPSVRAEYALDSVDVPQFGHVRSRGRSGFVREIPKLSKEQLEVSTEAEILESVQGPLELEQDYSNWIEAEEVYERPGGARAQTMELCELAKENYERVIPLIPKLVQQGSDYTVAELLMSLADSELPAEDAHRLVAELSQLGAPSEHFRSNAG